MTRAASAIMLVLLFVSVLTYTLNVKPTNSWTGGPIYIRADGSIDPSTAPIERNGDKYTLTGNITINTTSYGIWIQRNNMILDGAGYTIQFEIGPHPSEGIHLGGTINVTVTNTKITSFDYGIVLYGASHNSISGNIINNLIGISLSSSHGNTLTGNTFIGGGLLVEYSYQNVVEDNTINGKPLAYLESASDLSINNAGQAILVNCTNIRVENLYSALIELLMTNSSTIEGNNRVFIVLDESYGNSIRGNNYIGVWLKSSSGNDISSNNITTSDIGVDLEYSSGNIIAGNNITANEFGIRIGSSCSNNISGNNIRYNKGAGIFLGAAPYCTLPSSDNTIIHNNFVDNHVQVGVSSYAQANIWDDGYPSGGNYWSDYAGVDEKSGPNQNQPGSDGIGDTPYVINSNNRDNYPLINTFADFSLSASPLSLSINKGESITFTLTLTSIGGFASEVYLSASVAPSTSDMTLTLSPTSVTLTSGGSAQSTLTVSTTSTTPLETFTVAVTATGEGKTKTATCQVSVEIYLEVPYEEQSMTQWCYATSTAMVLRYYGKFIHVWDVGKAISLPVRLGSLEKFIHDTYPGEFKTRIGRYSAISNQIREDIIGNLTKGYPIILNVDPDPAPEWHNVVVTGFNSSGFFIHDPSGELFCDGLKKYPSSPYIHEFATWEELKPFIFKEWEPWSNAVFLVVEGTPAPLNATLHVINGKYLSVRTLHNSDIEKGVCIEYAGSYWSEGLYWNFVGVHPIVWDQQDSLEYYYSIFNHKNYKAEFDFHLKILGINDQKVYYENSAIVSVDAFDFSPASCSGISLKELLIEGQQYVVTAEIKYHGSQETIDSITLPPISYSTKSIMLITECPVRMLVTDPDGLRTGFDSLSNQTINEIPNALYYCGNGSQPETISIANQKIGNYSVTVFGIESGTYNLTCASLNEAGFLSVDSLINKSIGNNESQTYIVPEFPSTILLLLFMVLTMLVAAFAKRKFPRKLNTRPLTYFSIHSFSRTGKLLFAVAKHACKSWTFIRARSCV